MLKTSCFYLLNKRPEGRIDWDCDHASHNPWQGVSREYNQCQDWDRKIHLDYLEGCIPAAARPENPSNSNQTAA